LHRRAREHIEDPDTDVFVSAASVWEAAIKHKSGKLRIAGDLRAELREGGFSPLTVTLDHGFAAGSLPLHHKDPFDRMLIAQAQLESLTIVTRDRRFAAYDVALLPA
jgi:PIN domain nuclease of toxin-antitoxin system